MEKITIEPREIKANPIEQIRLAGVTVVDMAMQDLGRLARNLHRARLAGQDLVGLLTGESKAHADKLIAKAERETSRTQSQVQQIETLLPADVRAEASGPIIDLTALEAETTAEPAPHALTGALQSDGEVNWFQVGALTAECLKSAPTDAPPEDYQRALEQASDVMRHMPMPVAALGLEPTDTALLESYMARVANPGRESVSVR